MTNLGAKGFNPKRGTIPILQWMPPKMLGIDPAYQRSIDNTTSKALIQRIAKDWNWDLCQPLVVSLREDRSMFVVDGQHRLAAALARGDIDQLPCFICSLPDISAEAERFVQFNRNRKALKPLDLWKASVASGDADARQVLSALDAAGLHIHSSSNNAKLPLNTMVFTTGLQRCLKEQGYDRLVVILSLLASAFEGQPLQYAGTLFNGIAAIIAIETRECSPLQWSNSARQIKLIECLQSRLQVQWFNRVQRVLAEGSNRREATNRAFCDAWSEHLRGQGPTKPAPGANAPWTEPTPPPPPPPAAQPSELPKPPAGFTAPKPKPKSLDPLAKAIIEKHGVRHV
jgi:hypothetical protein